jgi:hypothetical protein
MKWPYPLLALAGTFVLPGYHALAGEKPTEGIYATRNAICSVTGVDAGRRSDAKIMTECVTNEKGAVIIRRGINGDLKMVSRYDNGGRKTFALSTPEACSIAERYIMPCVPRTSATGRHEARKYGKTVRKTIRPKNFEPSGSANTRILGRYVDDHMP